MSANSIKQAICSSYLSQIMLSERFALVRRKGVVDRGLKCEGAYYDVLILFIRGICAYSNNYHNWESGSYCVE